VLVLVFSFTAFFAGSLDNRPPWPKELIAVCVRERNEETSITMRVSMRACACACVCVCVRACVYNH